MTSDITTCNVPSFRTHSHAIAIMRALWIVTVCAALTAGFLTHVWRAPPSDLQSTDLSAQSTAGATREAT